MSSPTQRLASGWISILRSMKIPYAFRCNPSLPRRKHTILPFVVLCNNTVRVQPDSGPRASQAKLRLEKVKLELQVSSSLIRTSTPSPPRPTLHPTMGILRRVLAVTGWGTLGSAAAFTIYTRKSKMYQVSDADYLLGTTIFARYNPNNNPAMKDVCIRSVPTQQIRPDLLEQESKLVETFCGAVFSGWGM